MTAQLDNPPIAHQTELFPPLPRPAAPPPRPSQGPGTSRWLVLALVIALAIGLVIGRSLPGSEPAGSASVTAPAASSPIPAGTDVASVAAAVAPAVVQLESAEGLGSGVIYQSNGLILTAAHVIDGAETVQVRLADGRLFEGAVVGRHDLTDVGVVSIDAAELPVAMLGYGTPTLVGETAIALGSPFGFAQTVTAGIVSATGRTVNGVPMVQTDAAINPGNSGGPLVNASGQVIGINDIIFTQGGGNDGIGFAIAVEVAIVVADQLVAGEDVQLAGLGTATIPDTSGVGGAVVRDVVSGSPADSAGLAIGDRIIAIDDDRIVSPADLFAAVVSHRPGTQVVVEFVRGSDARQISVVLAGIEL